MIVIQPCFDFDVELLDFSDTAELLDMAYGATMQEQTAFTHLIVDSQTSEEARQYGPALN